MHGNIGAKPYDCIDATQNGSTSNIETVKICRDDEINNW